MLPTALQAADFAAYPPQARVLIVAHLAVLQQLPLSFVPSLLREAIDYDLKFPAERSAIESELDTLSRLTPARRAEWFLPFQQIALSRQLQHFDWVAQPGQFVEQLSAHLWTTHQMDAFRQAATAYGARLQQGAVPAPLPVRRLGIAVIGKGVSSYDRPLFKNLRQHGTCFTQLVPDKGVSHLLQALEARAKAHPVPYGHWYIDGGEPEPHGSGVTCVSYEGSEAARAALLANIQQQIARPGMGPEELRTYMATLTPAAVGMGSHGDAVLNHFQLKLLTEGSGTQIFSTAFAQWAAREALRRAQPLTMLVRFAPRQRQRAMNELLSGNKTPAELDPAGSLVDADMSAYYQWINQQRLAGADASLFLVWFEGSSQALAIAPSLPRGTESNSRLSLAHLVAIMDA